MTNLIDTAKLGPQWKVKERRGPLAPNLRLWIALNEGKILQNILVHFYQQVMKDSRLAPFFEGVTIDRIIGKQHSFLMSIFTGKKLYFGDRPRNAHHWMVISDSLFDHRERLFEASIRAFDLEEEHVQAMLATNEIFRKQIVKSDAIAKKVRGVALPLEGYEELILSCGAICDECKAVLDTGDQVSYHVRTGRTYCSPCSQERENLSHTLQEQ